MGLFPDRGFDQCEIDQYNSMLTEEYQRSRDFIILHYWTTERDDSDFWNHCRTMEIPDTLMGKIELWMGKARVLRTSLDGFARGDDASDQSQVSGRWKVTAQYGLWAFGDPSWTFTEMPSHPNKVRLVGGAALIQLGPDEFLLAGSDVRIGFGLANPRPGDNVHFLSVEEGTFEDGRWVMKRRWSGDQTDYGLNLGEPTLLKVRLGVWR
jgi:hypothetical protein